MTALSRRTTTTSPEPTRLKPIQVAWLAAAIFAVSAGFGALMPVLPAWLTALMPGATAAAVARHVGFLSGAYAVGVLLGAPLWGAISDHVGHGRILILGLIGYVASSLLLLVPALTAIWGMYALRGATGFFLSRQWFRWLRHWLPSTLRNNSAHGALRGSVPCRYLVFCSAPQ